MIYSELLPIIISVASVSTAVFAIILYINNKQRKNRDEEKLTRAELSFMRERIERQIYELNEKLYSDPTRWKDVNHLLLNTQDKEVLRASNTLINNNFFKNLGINFNEIGIKKDLVFFLTPFHNDFEEEFIYIQKICSDVGLNCSRGDEDFVKGNVLRYILERILASRIVIANLNGRNPNVYYELGIAHAIGKPVILVANAKTFKEIPFDLQSNKLIIYERPMELRKSLTNALTQILIEPNK